MLFDYFKNIEFQQPYSFGLFLVIPLLIFQYLNNFKNSTSSINIPVIDAAALSSFRSSFRHILFMLRLLALCCAIVALARPQLRFNELKTEGEGIDIILCIDVSGSMTARDFQPNRLEAAKAVAINFVLKRPTDRIGVVIFSGESFTLCPVTTDQAIIISAIRGIRNGLLEDGTAIGSGLSTSVDRLRSSKSKSRIVVMLTDGVNNGGYIDPNTAKEIAKAFNVKVYTIGVGSEGYAPQPVNTPIGVVIQNEKVSIDEKLLTQIATETGGQYFRARDNESLNTIYSTIDKLEKSKIQIIRSTRYEERFYPLILAALALLILEIILRYTYFRKFP